MHYVRHWMSFKVEYDDLTKALEGGKLPLKAENKIFFNRQHAD